MSNLPEPVREAIELIGENFAPSVARTIHDHIADLESRLAALAGAATDKPVEWIAQNHHDYWTVQVMCGPGPRFYSIRKADGQLLELPHKDSPFIPNPFAPHAPANAREDVDLAVAVLNAAYAYEREEGQFPAAKDKATLRKQVKLLREFAGPIIDADNAAQIAKRDAEAKS